MENSSAGSCRLPSLMHDVWLSMCEFRETAPPDAIYAGSAWKKRRMLGQMTRVPSGGSSTVILIIQKKLRERITSLHLNRLLTMLNTELTFQNFVICSALLALGWRLLRLFAKHPFDNLPGPPSPSFFSGLCPAFAYTRIHLISRIRCRKHQTASTSASMGLPPKHR